MCVYIYIHMTKGIYTQTHVHVMFVYTFVAAVL